MNFKDQVVIVTGSTKGIGKGIADAFLEAGAKVVMTAHETTDVEKTVAPYLKQKKNVLGITADVSKTSDVDRLMKETIKKWGKLDVLVNNAGIYPFKAFADMSENDFMKVIDVNLRGVFLTSKTALPHLLKSKGNIVNISSIAAIRGYSGLVHYCASKGGVDGFMRALSIELAGKGVRVNNVNPGFIETEGTKAIMDEKARAAAAKTIPVLHNGKPADIAKAVLYLADKNNGFITGQTIVVDGGETIKAD